MVAFVWNLTCILFILFVCRYLKVPNIVSAAVTRGCTMLHPGYGFLSENATFVDICKDHGINFIGPNVSFYCVEAYILMFATRQGWLLTIVLSLSRQIAFE